MALAKWMMCCYHMVSVSFILTSFFCFQGSLYLQDQFHVTMHYSQPKMGPEKVQKCDWVCTKCGAHNFKRRDFCFQCSVSREESERAKEGDGFDQVGTNPCNTLIFRGLDALTTEETLSQALSQQMSLTLKNIKIIRDELTNTSQGYGFAEMGSILESTQVLEHLRQMNPPFEVEGKLILVAFAKNTFSTVMATLNSRPNSYTGGQMQRSWNYDQQHGDYYYNPSGYEHSTFYDQNNPHYGQGQGYDSSYYNQNYTHQADSTNAAAAVAQAAIQQAQAAKQYQKHYQKQVQEQQKLAEMSPEQRLAHLAQNWSQQKNLSPSSQSSQALSAAGTAATAAAVTVGAPTTVDVNADGSTITDSSTHKGSPTVSKLPVLQSSQPAFQTPTGMPVNDEYPKYPSPDVCTYQYDDSSGYYYDPSTGLYYDANSQYYYNASTCQFLYWDAEKSTYLPAPTGAGGQQCDDKDGDNRGKKKEDKKEKVKIAKKIAKDMEKWAKTLNAQKEAIKEGFKKTNVNIIGPVIPMKRVIEERESATADAGYAILEKTSSGRGLEDKRLMPPPCPMTPTEKAAAAAAAAAAATEAVAANNPALVASYGGDSDSEDESFETTPAPGNTQRTGVLDEAKLTDWNKLACLLCKRQFPSKEALTRHTQLSDLHKQNLEVMRKKYSSGAVDGDKKGPAQRRLASAGLGARGANIVCDVSDSYKTAVKKSMFARYHELE
ncbi:RNA-binding protein 5 isoform X3 [Octopus bimaculoides]|uniref:RanBP2-type domain-containing protein n=1 Tax=Octopus bimaculoides TaxID=37653 RepID=A0A0L8HSW5_OCTBM|nr:RNA-binding protein 5 isoform X3 [Octopus bimaculoides]|eukprot:XP_014769656.1 PREDICTED: RNA-binding protein 5-like isoform X3 [Octopus bimaculoides]